MGAGSVGCYFGAMLAMKGFNVTLIGREKHINAIKNKGLIFESENVKKIIKINSSLDPKDLRSSKIIFICVKSNDTKSVARQISKYLIKDSLVVSLQNGVENHIVLKNFLVNPVIPSVVYVATEMLKPGHVKHNGLGEIVLPKNHHNKFLSNSLAKAKINVSFSSNIDEIMWKKLIINCAYNAISAISQKCYGDMFKINGVRDVMKMVVQECIAVAEAENISISNDIFDLVNNLVIKMPRQFSSTAQDVFLEKKNEIDYLNGYVCRRGKALGIKTPVNLTLLTLVKLIDKNNKKKL